jgi:hypothetical protein
MLSIVSILSVPDEGYSRNASWALHLIFTFLLRWDCDQIMINFARGTTEQSRSGSLYLLYSVGLQQATILRTPRHEGKFTNCLIPFCVVEICYELGYATLFPRPCEDLHNNYFLNISLILSRIWSWHSSWRICGRFRRNDVVRILSVF